MTTETTGLTPGIDGPAVSVQGLSVTPFGASRPVVSNVSFQIAAGERVLLLGPSGAGKSTLLLALTGALAELEIAQIVGTISAPSSGLLLQNSADSSVADTVFRDVAFGAESAGLPRLAIGDLVHAALSQVGLGGLDTARNPETLSGGELARACLAGLMVLGPRLLLLDEPTAMLDSESAKQVRDAVVAYLDHSGATAIIVEHHFTDWAELAGRTLVLDSAGRLIADGPTTRVLTEHAPELADWGLWLPGAAPIPSREPGRGSTVGDDTAGSITALVGRSGSGKSTRLANQVSSEAEVGSIGWMPQNPLLSVAGNSVLESVLAPEATASPHRDRAVRLLDAMGLSGKSDQSPFELSGGELRRLALATALLRKPKRLYLDEPTVGQDSRNWVRVVDAILDARDAGAEINLATHDRHLLALVDHVIDLDADTSHSAKPPVRPVAGRPLPFSPFGLLGASAVTLACSLFFSSVASAAWALGIEAVLVSVLMVAYPALRHPRLIWPVLVGVASVGFSNWWLSTDHTLAPAMLVALRVGFFGLPGVVLAAGISPSQLGDQLGQLLRLPARPMVAGMVGLYRVQRLRVTWANLALMRGIRGLKRKGFLGGLLELRDLTLLTLVDATRGAQHTAIAMETRGFSSRDADGRLARRSWAEPASFGRGDLWLVLTALAVGSVGLLFR